MRLASIRGQCVQACGAAAIRGCAYARAAAAGPAWDHAGKGSTMTARCAGPQHGAIRRSAYVPAGSAGVRWEDREKGGAIMNGPVTVSERDLRTLLGIVRDDRGDLPPDGLPLSLLAELTDQIRCDAVTFSGQDPYRQEIRFTQDVPADCDDAGCMQAFWEHFWDSDACAYAYRSGDLRSVTRQVGLAAPVIRYSRCSESGESR
jgi:hypothetical protein